MSRFAFPDLNRAFRDGERFGDEAMRVIEAGDLILPTGRVVACDPYYLESRPSKQCAYTRTVTPGRYRVFLAILGRHVACAKIQFLEGAAERWEMALRPEWDPTILKPGCFHGYGVDAGTGCFADEAAILRLPEKQTAYDEFLDQQRLRRLDLWQELQGKTAEDARPNSEAMRLLGELLSNSVVESYQALVPPELGQLFACLYSMQVDRPFASAVLDAATGANIICFSSGWGDGCYASWFGLNREGVPACLVTDFGLLTRAVSGILELRVPVVEQCDLIDPKLAEIEIDRVNFKWNPSNGEVAIDMENALHVQQVRFENRPGCKVPQTAWGGFRCWFFKLDEPLQPTARALIKYILRTEAL